MPPTILRPALFCALVLCLVLLGGCGDATGDRPLPGSDAVDGSDGSDALGPDAEAIDPSAFGGEVPVTLSVTPENPVLEAELGSGEPLPSVGLELVATFADGRTERFSGEAWGVSDPSIAAVAASGLVTATGLTGGATRVTGERGGMSASTQVTVVVAQSVVDGGVTDPEAVAGLFPPQGGVANPGGSADPTAPGFVYPADETVFPALGIHPPLVQWDRGGHELFKLVLRVAPAIELVVYTDQDRYQVTPEQWRVLSEPAGNQAVRLELYGRTGMDPAQPAWQALGLDAEIAEADLTGVIYYWALNVGNIMKIEANSLTPEPVFSDGCHACHVVSRDGRKLAFEYDGGWQWAGVIDVTRPESPLVERNVMRGNFLTFNGDGTRLVNAFETQLLQFDPATGAELEPVAGAGPATHPTWSPDSTVLAYVGQAAGSTQPFGDVDFFESDIVLQTWDGSGNFTDRRVLVPSEGMANSYPSWTPDSQWLAYSRGPYSRSHTEYDPNQRSAPSPGELYLTAPSGSTEPVRLERAGAGGHNLFPAFSPFKEGGYYWMVFFTRRRYGHVIPADAWRRQLWITAVDIDMVAGQDPSHPAFWLPGQDAETENMTAYWAPLPCSDAGESCRTDQGCCGGLYCGPTLTCQSAGECQGVGQSCSADSDCCPGTECNITQVGTTVCVDVD